METQGGFDGCQRMCFEQIMQVFMNTALSKLYPAGFDPIDEGDLDGSFMSHSLLTHPRNNLYHYFPDSEVVLSGSTDKFINYSRESLKSGRVHLSSPRTFNDPYDCTLAIDKDKELATAIRRCAKIIGMGELTAENASELADEFATKRCDSESCQVIGGGDVDQKVLSVKQFRLASQLSAMKSGRIELVGEDILEGAWSVVKQELDVGDRMRVFCLSTSGINPSMWAYYAHGNKGFCVEYDVGESYKASAGGCNQATMDIIENTRPVIYRMNRPDCTDIVADMLFGLPDERQLDDLYRQSLYVKGLNWGLEQEWRLVLPKGFAGIDEHDNIAFFPVKSVCAGALMDGQKLDSLCELCGYIGVPLYKLVPDERLFNYQVLRVL